MKNTENKRAARKERSRVKIQMAAARAFRRDGLNATGIRKVMNEAGLTIGGFYSHYDSKEALVRDAFSAALSERIQPLSASIAGERGASYVNGFLEGYLNVEHRDAPETGCPYAALLSELAREGPTVRARVRSEFEASVSRFAAHLDERTIDEARRKAIVAITLAIGALGMSRILSGSEASDEVLRACRMASAYLLRRT
jgi:TetR/AcrR family transcriptional repressor of nem operon